MVKKITCIRHGHPISNLSDPHLSDDGLKQAGLLSGDFDLIILSPLRRAIETYTRSNVSGKKIIVSDLAREQMDLKMYNQLRIEEPCSETVEEMLERMRKFRDFLIEQPEENICVFSSAFAICYLQQVCGYSSKPLNYTDIVKIEID